MVAVTVLCTEGKKKSVLDYNDADVERIFREWEVSEIVALQLSIKNSLIRPSPRASTLILMVV